MFRSCCRGARNWNHGCRFQAPSHFLFLMFRSCCRGTQNGNYRCRFQAPTHFTFLMFSSWCRLTQTGNHRCRFQAPTNFKYLMFSSYYRGTKNGNHRCRFQAHTHFTFLMFSSCCRGTQTGNHRCRFQAPTHVNVNSNLHNTIRTTTCADIKSSTCKISNPLRAGRGMSLKLHGASDTTIMKMSRWYSLTFLMYINNQIGHISKGLEQTMRRPI